MGHPFRCWLFGSCQIQCAGRTSSDGKGADPSASNVL